MLVTLPPTSRLRGGLSAREIYRMGDLPNGVVQGSIRPFLRPLLAGKAAYLGPRRPRKNRAKNRAWAMAPNAPTT